MVLFIDFPRSALWTGVGSGRVFFRLGAGREGMIGVGFEGRLYVVPRAMDNPRPKPRSRGDGGGIDRGMGGGVEITGLAGEAERRVSEGRGSGLEMGGGFKILGVVGEG